MSLEAAWYRKAWWLNLLWPLALLFRGIAAARRRYWQRRHEKDARIGKTPGTAPVVIVGNITVGGTGKTPFVIALGRLLQGRGLTVGVVSRGYSATAPHHPYTVTENSHPYLCGDEPLLIVRSLQCPVVVDPNRPRALAALPPCDVIISDDGMQHYAMARDIEIALIDGERGLGNGLCLPAGPLREPPSRLREIDYLVVNGGECRQWIAMASDQAACSSMMLVPRCWVNVRSGEEMDLRSFARMAENQTVHAVAGIGNPERFFALLRTMGIEAVYHAFPDHYNFASEDLPTQADELLLMTEKDAVKCQGIAGPDAWYLAVEAELDEAFTQRLLAHIETLVRRGPSSTPRPLSSIEPVQE